MRMRNLLTLSALLTIMLALASCNKDKVQDVSEGEPVTITLTLNPAVTRSPLPGDADDNRVSSLRVLIYKFDTGELAFNIPIAYPSDRLEIITGKYDFVFIANEDSDPALAAKLANDADVSNISKLRALSFARSAFDAEKDIPMVTLIEWVDVIADDMIQTPDMPAPVTGTWNVGLERVGIRLKLEITLSQWQYTDWDKKIYINNIPGLAYVLPADNSASIVTAFETFNASLTSGAEPGEITVNSDGTAKVVYNRLILPETFLTSANNTASKGLNLKMEFRDGEDVKTAKICAADDEEDANGNLYGYSVPRNKYLHIKATVKEDAINVQILILDWDLEIMDVPDFGDYRLAVSQRDFDFDPNGTAQTLEIYTNYGEGWYVDSKPSWLHVTPDGGSSGTVSLECDPGNFIAPNRTGQLVIKAGTLSRIINITQKPLS